MGFPKQIKKTIPLIDKKILLPRRHEIANMISDDGTYLPKSLLHADLDRGFLDFVKDELRCVVEGSLIPTVDIMITTQNWSSLMSCDSSTITSLKKLPRMFFGRSKVR